ncbi:alpha/beta hydrolase-fold protein [Alteromonas sp. 1_MG-2023]|uniref:alpha/beta hydrolase n=1 Tax=Alteromonas sp. 1_MG-2023 TaxID=3062669 RepID=UPI0026E2808E|nr:alpha/beta hydrolase-fold protein [Alteromonas sp. 1_MG-2023]MDO6474999.1 alpha/beta hydrolase-fold protein [Alteromonas sp. 1_MG-2023]
MYKSALLLVLFVFWKTAGASNESSPASKISVHSTILQEIRNVHIYLPPDYEGSDSLFPVIYVTDGDIHRLRAIAGVVEGLSTATLENQMRQAVIVAIPNTHRSRDLTPSVLPEWTFENRKLDTFEQSGGAKQFRDFLKTELFPYIESRYRVSTERILVGESFGGLFAADTLLHQPDLFSGYLIMTPQLYGMTIT